MRPSPEEALVKLLEGNRRFLAGEQSHPRANIEIRRQLTLGQEPLACILGCADSRVPPQLIFDQVIGDLFMVRVAGNVLDDVVIGSIEFAVAVLETPLVMVLGHQNCGAVRAAIEHKDKIGHLRNLTERIEPVFACCKDPNDPEEVAQINAKEVAKRLRLESLLATRIEAGQLKVVAAYYEMHHGTVQILSES
ncbi:MAG: hypothetical protein A2527_07865 [Candidatus Lambdaproteobacteria bacterium RIFOXYD2_FULL_50_16]|uniref:Carbonic anhydrase n=1 Tax=Candidatus Lambdaproteobacteria bacterium RIFOXYD2_FULL_50_16 TaxID=1817772 RepID=A0A1F6GAE6_9PROT|nr:MAG: hypothetical protein A2527_07865 [Candidatus Lambdaproteobacteria bacterium RIFOXYD2_FULL_50_16]